MNEAEKREIPLRRDKCVNKGKTKNQRHGTGPCPYITGHHLVWRCPIRCRGRQNKLEGRLSHSRDPSKLHFRCLGSHGVGGVGEKAGKKGLWEGIPP